MQSHAYRIEKKIVFLFVETKITAKFQSVVPMPHVTEVHMLMLYEGTQMRTAVDRVFETIYSHTGRTGPVGITELCVPGSVGRWLQ